MALTKIGKEGVTGISNSSNATAITIDSSENVGIGVASMTNKLVLPNAAYFAMQDSSAAENLAIRANSSNAMEVLTGGAVRMTINSSGALLVGTTDTSPFNNTSGSGTTIAGGEVQIASSSSESLYLNRFGSDGRVVNIRKGGSFIGGIDVSTSQVTYNQTSDYRLKENVSYNWDATTRLKQLKPARFNYIVDADNTVDGFLAHEVEGIVPQAITGEKDAVDSDGNIDPQCIDHSKLVPLLVKTIQELEARIAALEAS